MRRDQRSVVRAIWAMRAMWVVLPAVMRMALRMIEGKGAGGGYVGPDDQRVVSKKSKEYKE